VHNGLGGRSDDTTRVAALAGGGEILATAETIAAAGKVATSEPRTVTVKGVSVPVTLAVISWS